MARPRARLLAAVAVLGTLLAACGSQDISLDEGETQANRTGARIFLDKCAGCHTLDVVGAQGSSVNVSDKERVDGPNFNVRKEEVDQVLYAIRNGGFSGAIMPENMLVGREAQLVADFLAKYSGRKSTGNASTGN